MYNIIYIVSKYIFTLLKYYNETILWRWARLDVFSPTQAHTHLPFLMLCGTGLTAQPIFWFNCKIMNSFTKSIHLRFDSEIAMQIS